MIHVAVIGAGIAGASVAAALSERFAVTLVEAEAQAGYHSTGRSAAMWIGNLGPADVQRLSAESRDFFLRNGFGTPRDVVYLEDDPVAFAALLAGGLEELAISEVAARVPLLRRGYARRAAVARDAFDIDVAAVHQFFLRQVTGNGGKLRTRARASAVAWQGGSWRVETRTGEISADILVNAAGAWADEVAVLAGVEPVGLTACRRTAVIIDAGGVATAGWPMLKPASQTWYVRPEARLKLLVSPADETPVPAHDVQPEELDVATAIDRVTAALDVTVNRVEHAWAGLRTFAPDRNLVLRWGDAARRFFWCAGQGGYGIQTAPAAAARAAGMIRNIV